MTMDAGNWTLDRIIRAPGTALEYIKTFQQRERDLLEANNRLLERVRQAEAGRIDEARKRQDWQDSAIYGSKRIAALEAELAKVG
jgi:hypothetical protein